MSALLPEFVDVNGRMLAAGRAAINAFDRGLLYGDGLFETLRAYEGQTFGIEPHLKRLRESARFLGIVLPRRAWHHSIANLLRRNRLHKTDAWVRITVTRGVGRPGLLPAARMHPTVIIAAGPLDPAIAKAQRRGVRVALLPFARHDFLAEHKVLNYVGNVIGKVMATRHRAFEGLFVDAGGYVTEGTTTNVFVWRRGHLYTPPIEGILPGLTRQLVIGAAGAAGVRVIQRPLKTHDVLDADEVFLTSSVAEVIPVIAVNARSIGNGKVGSFVRRIQGDYRQIVDRALGNLRRR